MSSRQLAIRDAHELAAPEVFHGGDFALDCGDILFHAIDDLIDGIFLAAVIQDEGRAVAAFGRVHFCLCD